MREIEPSALDKNVFQLVGEDWMLVTAGGPDKLNTMTASWGGLGVIWGEPAATVYLRPQRYTKEFVDAHDTFTLSFFDEGWRKQLAYLGTVSGRDEDKVAKAGLTPAFDQAGPYFEEASLVFVCRKAYVQAFEEALLRRPLAARPVVPRTRPAARSTFGLVEKVLGERIGAPKSRDAKRGPETQRFRPPWLHMPFAA